LLLLSAGPVWASGINLGWNDCPGGATYSLVKTFACDMNTATHTLVGSFVAPAGVVAVSANEIVIDMAVAPLTPLPDWWTLRATAPAGCRAGSLTSNFDFTGGPGTCFDYWQGVAQGGISQDPLDQSYGRARIKVLGALPAGDPGITGIPEGTDVYSFKAIINSAKTVGPGSCTGCGVEACIVLQRIQLNQPLGPPGNGVSIRITNPATVQHVIWQAWTTLDPVNACPLVTPAKRKTWGSVKSLYR
jgi:hypothetical protein